MAATGGGSAFGIIGKLFGNAVSSAVGFGAGVALGPVMGPVVRDIANSVNSKYSFVFPDPETLAAGVAQGQIAEDTARRWASYHGVGDDAFSGLRAIADVGPPLASALTLLRRGVWLPGQYDTALNRAAIEKMWWGGLHDLKDEWLTPSELAVMVQRSVVPNPGVLPFQPSTEGSNVPVMPAVPIDTLREAAGGGANEARLAARARIIGLPASPDLAARMLFRNIITEGAYNLAILEGNTRGEWAPYLLDGFRQILTAAEYAEADLRGWITHAERDAGAAKHGMSAEDADLLWKLHGRPLNIHQITTGLARGGKYNPVPGELTDPYQAAVRLGSLRPEYYDLDIANKYTLPSAFVMRGLTQTKVWNEAKAAQRLKEAGWIPEDADEAAAFWAKGTTAAAKEATAADLLALYDGRRATAVETLAALEALGYPADEAQTKIDVLAARRVAAARSTVVSDLHAAFKKEEITSAAATAALGQLDIPATQAAQIVTYWQVYLDAFPPPTPAPAA